MSDQQAPTREGAEEAECVRCGATLLACHCPPGLDTPVDLNTLPAVARAAGVEYRTLHSWVRRGLIIPSHPSSGTGRPAYFSDREAEICGMLARMRDAGLGMDVLLGASRAASLQPTKDVIELQSGDGVRVVVQVGKPANRKAVS